MSIFDIHTTETAPEQSREVMAGVVGKFGFLPNIYGVLAGSPAVIKAYKKGNAWLADRVYSGVPASMVGKHQVIEIGHMSGESNVVAWLSAHGYEPAAALVAELEKRYPHSEELRIRRKRIAQMKK